MSDIGAIVAELVELLGLYPGIEVRPVKAVEMSSEGRLIELQKRLSDSDEVDSHCARFAAIYLPSLVQSATAQLHDNNTSSLPMLNKGINWTVQVIILAEQYASRFVREHPEEALQLFEGLTYCVSQASRLPEAAFEERNTQSKLFLLDRGADRLAESLVANATRFSSPAILALDGPTQLGMRRTVRRLEAVGEKPTALLASLSTGIIHLRMSRRHLVEEASWPYWNCEIRKHDEETGACVVLPAGEEMAVCARCLSVRYCSRAHQKADWTRHKLVCFKPSW